MPQLLHLTSNNNKSRSHLFQELAINIDNRNDIDDSNDSSLFNSVFLGGEETDDSLNVTIRDNMISDRVHGVSSNDTGSITDGTFEGLGSLHSHYALIMLIVSRTYLVLVSLKNGSFC